MLNGTAGGQKVLLIICYVRLVASIRVQVRQPHEQSIIMNRALDGSLSLCPLFIYAVLWPFHLIYNPGSKK